jgi:hypothetical protein
VKRIGSIRSDTKELKNIPFLDQFYPMALNRARPLPKNNNGNKYIFVAIDHYSKWVEAKAIANHKTKFFLG